MSDSLFLAHKIVSLCELRYVSAITYIMVMKIVRVIWLPLIVKPIARSISFSFIPSIDGSP